MVFRACRESRAADLLIFAVPWILLAAALALAFTRNPFCMVGALPVSFLCHAVARRSVSRSARATLPVAGLALILTLLQLLNHRFDLTLAAKMLGIFWLTAAAFHLLRWQRVAEAIRPGAPFSKLALFLLFIRHFALILAGESWRVLHARERVIYKPYGKWAFRSLNSALVSLFLRAMIRAERFYAAQLLKGLAQ